MSEFFKVGDEITKKKGYAFNGVVVSVFKNTKGQIRVVAEHYGSQTEESGGMLHIFSEAQLCAVACINKCDCREDKKTGTTTVMCCNTCGLPDDKGWIVG